MGTDYTEVLELGQPSLAKDELRIEDTVRKRTHRTGPTNRSSAVSTIQCLLSWQ